MQFWEKNFLRTTMNLIDGVPWAEMAVSFQQFFPPECHDIFRDHVAQVSSSDRKNPKNHQKRSPNVYDHLFFVPLGCWILVPAIFRYGVACLGLIFLQIFSVLAIWIVGF